MLRWLLWVSVLALATDEGSACGASAGPGVAYEFGECSPGTWSGQVLQGRTCRGAADATAANNHCMLDAVLTEVDEEAEGLQLMTGGCPDHVHGAGVIDQRPHGSGGPCSSSTTCSHSCSSTTCSSPHCNSTGCSHSCCSPSCCSHSCSSSCAASCCSSCCSSCSPSCASCGTCSPSCGNSSCSASCGPSSCAPSCGPSSCAPSCGPSSCAPSGNSSCSASCGPSSCAPSCGPSSCAPSGNSSCSASCGPSSCAPSCGPSSCAPSCGPSSCAPSGNSSCGPSSCTPSCGPSGNSGGCCGGCNGGCSGGCCGGCSGGCCGGCGCGCGCRGGCCGGCGGGCCGCSLGPNTPAFGNWLLEIPRRPVITGKPTRLPGSGVIGIAVNGVIFMQHGMTRVFDNCMGHVDGHHNYHYHLPPTCLLNSLNSTGHGSWWANGGWPARAEPSPLIGWALDGWPIFGPYDEDGVLMTNATLDKCNGKRLAGGGYGYFTTPSGGVRCFVGKPGRAESRGLQAPTRRCPSRGMRSSYCRPGTGPCPPLSTPACDRCEKVFFLFPVCPKVDFTCAAMARIFGTIYLIIFVVLLIRIPLQWAYSRYTGEATPLYLKVCRQSDNDWRPCLLTTVGTCVALRESAKLPWLDWFILRVFKRSQDDLRRVKKLVKVVTARGVQILRGVFVVAFTRAVFLLIDPFYFNGSIPAIVAGPLYGIAYPTLNWCFAQSVWVMLFRSGCLQFKKIWFFNVQTGTIMAEYLVQLFADLLRAVGISPSENRWLMICQIYFLCFGLSLAVLFFAVLPRVLRHVREQEAKRRRQVNTELVVLLLAAPAKALHSLYALIAMLPSDPFSGLPLWQQLFFKEVFIFVEFALILLYIVLTVYHASR